MADEGRQPVAIRIARPYPSEEAFLEHELDTLTRTSVVLLGAQSRPQGVVLRFEVTLASGAPLLRGEGRVVGYKPKAFNDEPGLTLRFTRLDPRSKALIDRAAALRDARARGVVRPEPPINEAPLEATFAGPPPSMQSPASASPAPPTARPPSLPPSTTPRGAFQDEAPSKTTAFDRDELDRMRSQRLEHEAADIAPPTNLGAPLSIGDVRGVHVISEPPPAVASRRSAPPSRFPTATPAPATVVPSALMTTAPPTNDGGGGPNSPPNRAALLERLRARARDLAPVRVREILEAKRA